MSHPVLNIDYQQMYLYFGLFYRYLKTREQEDVDYVANGKNVGHEMKYKTETMEVDKRGDDEVDLFDSLSTRARRRLQQNNRQPHRYRGMNQSFVCFVL